ncbi:winged helix-turn-helix domain-containing protein [Kitasatospora sp. MAP5-34]|uniref:ArsR/SmtB family transcription factor n=1 Tax=Kitasatospora sp. MAP5-34 TaxID=3035102 RepID=UPI002474FB99|nr:winged helix-turn-helix domain-containing protein [Kitasatospora sp. MAP5-34]MDH6580268.1 DNA-binding transcriptional ArsR family regulator [Kitasatospora sp. MAP5-34]
MLRLHFTAADLQRIRWAAHPEPLMETVFSLQLLQQPQATSEPFARWSAQVRQSIGRRELPLFDLAAADDGAVTELLIAPHGAASLYEGLAALQELPKARMIADLASARSMRPDLPQWITDVHHRRPEATDQFTRMLSGYHRMAIAPAWAYVEHAVRVAVDSAAATPDIMLNGLHPSISWQYPVLSVPCHLPQDVDLDLAGRGLVLVPAFFLRIPTARADNYDDQAPIEVYIPVRHPHAAPDEDDPRPDPGLTRLLGRTRAAVLTTLATARSTTEIATLAGISAATTSHHLNALRAGGLVTTARQHGTARHSLTNLGLRLLSRSTCTLGQPVTAFQPPG